MNNNQLGLILDKLHTIDINVDSIGKKAGTLETKIDSLNKRVGSLETKVDSLNKRVGSLETKVDSLDKRVATLEKDMSIVKTQLDENTQMLKAIQHRQEESDAKIESLTLDMAKLHGEVAQTDEEVTQYFEDQKSIKEMIGEHEIAIRSLKRQIV